MDRAKIALSAEELRLVSDPSVIFMKNSIISKVYALFGELSTAAVARFQLPAEVSGIPPKIARGEAYKGLPYVMLDYPRCFTARDIFALRTFFWWGRYVSVTLHLKGVYRDRLLGQELLNRVALFEDNVYISTDGEEWDHDLEGGGYRVFSGLPSEAEATQIREGSFLKVSCLRKLEEWDTLHEWLERIHREFGELIRY